MHPRKAGSQVGQRQRKRKGKEKGRRQSIDLDDEGHNLDSTSNVTHANAAIIMAARFDFGYCRIYQELRSGWLAMLERIVEE